MLRPARRTRGARTPTSFLRTPRLRDRLDATVSALPLASARAATASRIFRGAGLRRDGGRWSPGRRQPGPAARFGLRCSGSDHDAVRDQDPDDAERRGDPAEQFQPLGALVPGLPSRRDNPVREVELYAGNARPDGP